MAKSAILFTTLLLLTVWIDYNDSSAVVRIPRGSDTINYNVPRVRQTRSSPSTFFSKIIELWNAFVNINYLYTQVSALCRHWLICAEAQYSVIDVDHELQRFVFFSLLLCAHLIFSDCSIHSCVHAHNLAKEWIELGTAKDVWYFSWRILRYGNKKNTGSLLNYADNFPSANCLINRLLCACRDVVLLDRCGQ